MSFHSISGSGCGQVCVCVCRWKRRTVVEGGRTVEGDAELVVVGELCGVVEELDVLCVAQCVGSLGGI